MTWREFMNSCSSSADFYAKLAGVFIDTSLALTRIFLTDNWRNVQELEKKWLSSCHDIFDSKFREDTFVNSLSNAVDCFSKSAASTGFGQSYQNISNLTSMWNNSYIEPIRDTMWRTPCHKVYSDGKVALYHYNFAEKKNK